MVEEFHYRVPWRATSAHPGHHHSTATGGGQEFHGHASLINRPDPRNLDVHATLHDPFGEYKVRVFRQNSIIPVYVIVDLSASMGFGGKRKMLVQCVAAIAYSCFRTGDPFGFFPMTDKIEWQLHWPLRHYKSLAFSLPKQLHNFLPHGAFPPAWEDVAANLGRKKALVFLLSDFHFPSEKLTEGLERLQPHDVVPVILWEKREWQLPKRGIIRFRDPETGSERLLWLRPKLQQQIVQHFQTRRRQLTQLCRNYGRPPLWVIDHFSPQDFTRYFVETCA